MRLKKSTREKWKIVINLLLYLFPVVSFLFVIKFVAIKGNLWLDSDQAAELILAKLQNDEGSLFSHGWYYGNALRCLDISSFMRIGFLLSPDNWNVARIIGQGIALLCMFFSYLYFSRSFVNKRTSIVFATLTLFPFAFWYRFHVITFGFYAPYIMIVCITLGSIIRLINDEKNCTNNNETTKSNRRVICLAIIVVNMIIAFLAGLSGVRMLMCLYAPLSLMAAILLAKAMLNNRVVFENKLIVMSALFGVSNFAGYIVFSKILCERYDISKNYSDQSWAEFSIKNIEKAISWFFESFGYPYIDDWSIENINLFSVVGICGAFAIVIICYVAICIWQAIRRYDSYSLSQRIVIATMLSMIGVVGLSLSLLKGEDAYNGSYWMTTIPITLAVISIVIDSVKFQATYGKKVVLALLVFSMAMTSYAHTHTGSIRSVESLKPALEFVKSQGYTQGIADFWSSDVITAWTDDDIQMWTVVNVEDMNIWRWLQKKSHEEFPKGKLFIIVGIDEDNGNTYDIRLANFKYPIDGVVLKPVYNDNEWCVLEWNNE